MAQIPVRLEILHQLDSFPAIGYFIRVFGLKVGQASPDKGIV